MGNSTSSPSSQAEDTNRKLRKEIEKRGVLLPPSFLLNESLSIQNRQPLQPSLFDELHAHDASNRLLLDYMTPGLWISATDPVNQMRVAASIPLTTLLHNSVGSTTSTPIGSSLLLMERLGRSNALQLRVGNDLLPTISASYSLWNDKCTLFGHVKPNGSGWTGTHLEHILSENDKQPDKSFHLTLGGYVKGALVLAENKCPFHKAPVAADQVIGYAAIKFLGTTTAIETQIPLHPHQELRKTQTRTYFNIDLTGDVEGPPLQISLEKTATSHVLAVSQTIPFDRYQLNPMEDRAPKVRNTIAWTIRMEQQTQGASATAQTGLSASSSSAASTTAAPTSASSSSIPNLSMGAAWQINRSVGIKAVLGPVNGLTTALVLKRWNQPRLACSLVCQPQKNVFGIGLELETGRLRQAGYVSGINLDVGDNAVPETRATIPMMQK